MAPSALSARAYWRRTTSWAGRGRARSASTRRTSLLGPLFPPTGPLPVPVDDDTRIGRDLPGSPDICRNGGLTPRCRATTVRIWSRSRRDAGAPQLPALRSRRPRARAVVQRLAVRAARRGPALPPRADHPRGHGDGGQALRRASVGAPPDDGGVGR